MHDAHKHNTHNRPAPTLSKLRLRSAFIAIRFVAEEEDELSLIVHTFSCLAAAQEVHA